MPIARPPPLRSTDPCEIESGSAPARGLLGQMTSPWHFLVRSFRRMRNNATKRLRRKKPEKKYGAGVNKLSPTLGS
eukprot:scaffold34650_cov219-Amphora_coffeaeformis.AAC.6